MRRISYPPPPPIMPPPMPRKGMPGWLVALVTAVSALTVVAALAVLVVILLVFPMGRTETTYDCSVHGRASCQQLTQDQVDSAMEVWNAYGLENDILVDPSREYTILVHSISPEKPAKADDQYSVRHVDGNFYTFWVYYAPTATTNP